MQPATWKVDAVFVRMQQDDGFEPFVIMAPVVNQGAAYMNEVMDAGLRFFRSRGYPVYAARHPDATANGIAVADLNIDLLFFSNPHRLTTNECYQEAYTRYLSCYVPYSHSVSAFGAFEPQYDQPFHNAIWRIFAPHQVSLDIFERVGTARGRNVRVTGYPGCEALMAPEFKPNNTVWKKSPTPRLKVIWAPHHTIDMPSLPYANFLRFAEFFRRLAKEYSSEIQWAFKPHPLLKPKLRRHPDWGPDKTKRYFDFWEQSPFAQLEQGEYVDLFTQSDAMIHDSGSFLAEYLYLDKPVLFIRTRDDIEDYLNEFGLKAYCACQHAGSQAEIRQFVDRLIAREDDGHAARSSFRHQELERYIAVPPSLRIMEHLKKELLA